MKGTEIILRRDQKDVVVMDINDIRLRGRHNVANVMAAILATSVLNIELDSIRNTIRNFTGVSNRIEFVRELDGVKYFNDSSATSPSRSIAGINSFDEPLILIAGGSDNNVGVEEFAVVVGNKQKNLNLIGKYCR